MQSVREIKEKTHLTREEEQEKRYSNYQNDGDSLQVSQLEEEERYRVDNLLTGGVYFVTSEKQEKVCSCPDYETRCSAFNPPVQCKHIIAVKNWINWKKEQKAKREGIHNFDPHKFLIKVNGKDYLEVKFRLHWFRLENANWDIRTEIVQLDLEKGIALVRADIYDEKGNHKSSGLKMEIKSSFGDYAEKAETGAIGRALAALGYGTLQTFELEEGIDKGRIADSPVSLGNNGGQEKSLPKVTPITIKAGNNGGNGSNGKEKASLNQIRYLKDLCKKLEITPGIDLAGLPRERVSQYIEDLQKELEERKRKN